MDRILIKELLVRTIVGINDDERRNKQDVVINIVMWADLSGAGRSDRLDDTVNYRSINKRVLGFVETSSFYLIEALAQGIAEICLEGPLVERVQVTVEKPGALRFARSVGVEIVRDKDSSST